MQLNNVTSGPSAKIFWVFSLLVSALALVAMLALLWRVFALRRTTAFLRGFTTILLGNFLFAGSFATAGVVALVRHSRGELIPIPDKVCTPLAALSSIALSLMIFGTALAAYQPWHILSRSYKFSRAIAVTPKATFGFNLYASFVSVVIYLAAYSAGLTGDYRGLSCGFSSLGSWKTGGVLLGIIFVNQMFAVGYSIAIRRLTLQAKRSCIANAACIDASKFFRSLSNKMHVTFFATWFPFGVTIAAALVGKPLPAEADMVAGVFLCLKPLIDTIVIFSCTTFDESALVNVLKKNRPESSRESSRQTSSARSGATPKREVTSARTTRTSEDSARTGRHDSARHDTARVMFSSAQQLRFHEAIVEEP